MSGWFHKEKNILERFYFFHKAIKKGVCLYINIICRNTYVVLAKLHKVQQRRRESLKLTSFSIFLWSSEKTKKIHKIKSKCFVLKIWVVYIYFLKKKNLFSYKCKCVRFSIFWSGPLPDKGRGAGASSITISTAPSSRYNILIKIINTENFNNFKFLVIDKPKILKQRTLHNEPYINTPKINKNILVI